MTKHVEKPSSPSPVLTYSNTNGSTSKPDTVFGIMKRAEAIRKAGACIQYYILLGLRDDHERVGPLELEPQNEDVTVTRCLACGDPNRTCDPVPALLSLEEYRLIELLTKSNQLFVERTIPKKRSITGDQQPCLNPRPLVHAQQKLVHAFRLLIEDHMTDFGLVVHKMGKTHEKVKQAYEDLAQRRIKLRTEEMMLATMQAQGKRQRTTPIRPRLEAWDQGAKQWAQAVFCFVQEVNEFCNAHHSEDLPTRWSNLMNSLHPDVLAFPSRNY